MKSKPTGFTLIEVLIALTIVSVTLAAFARVTSLATTNMTHIEQQSLAMLSAQNSLNELHISTLPSSGVHQAECPQGEHDFICRLYVDSIEQGARQITVGVYASRDSGRQLAFLKTRLPEIR